MNGVRATLRVLTIIGLLAGIISSAACASTGAPTSSPQGIVAGEAVTPTPTAPPPTATATPTVLMSQTVTTSTTVTEVTPGPTFVPTPLADLQLELSRYAARPGEVVALRGEGFAPSETVGLEFSGNPPTAAGSLQANERGEVNTEALQIPALAEGQQHLVAKGTSSGRSVERVLSVIGFHPWVVLSNYAPRPGESFGFNGSEFVPGEELQVFLDGAQDALATTKADDRGNVQQEVLITAKPQDVGKHNLEFVGAQSGAHLPVAYEVLPFVPHMELSSYAGPPGTTLTFDGKGFAPNEQVHAFLEQNNSRKELTSFQADRDGAFTSAGQFVIPADTAQQDLNVVLEGDESHVPVSQRFGVLALAPWAGLSTYSGPPGTQISFHGKGFAAGETVDVYEGKPEGNAPIASAVADGGGEFETGPWVVPASATGTTTFDFLGQNSKGEATAQFFVVGQ